jgi:hypothetical protein
MSDTKLQPDSPKEPPINKPAWYVAGIVLAGAVAFSFLVAQYGPKIWELITELKQRFSNILL